ncbi:hypothetical protein IW262DRAFT_1292817 [Armillaria fumosa]|nr:hypothetical protein IW262DRAFT_1292817 [Armillaria fumosa]
MTTNLFTKKKGHAKVFNDIPTPSEDDEEDEDEMDDYYTRAEAAEEDNDPDTDMEELHEHLTVLSHPSIATTHFRMKVFQADETMVPTPEWGAHPSHDPESPSPAPGRCSAVPANRPTSLPHPQSAMSFPQAGPMSTKGSRMMSAFTRPSSTESAVHQQPSIRFPDPLLQPSTPPPQSDEHGMALEKQSAIPPLLFPRPPSRQHARSETISEAVANLSDNSWNDLVRHRLSSQAFAAGGARPPSTCSDGQKTFRIPDIPGRPLSACPEGQMTFSVADIIADRTSAHARIHETFAGTDVAMTAASHIIEEPIIRPSSAQLQRSSMLAAVPALDSGVLCNDHHQAHEGVLHDVSAISQSMFRQTGASDSADKPMPVSSLSELLDPTQGNRTNPLPGPESEDDSTTLKLCHGHHSLEMASHIKEAASELWAIINNVTSLDPAITVAHIINQAFPSLVAHKMTHWNIFSAKYRAENPDERWDYKRVLEQYAVFKKASPTKWKDILDEYAKVIELDGGQMSRGKRQSTFKNTFQELAKQLNYHAHRNGFEGMVALAGANPMLDGPSMVAFHETELTRGDKPDTEPQDMDCKKPPPSDGDVRPYEDSTAYTPGKATKSTTKPPLSIYKLYQLDNTRTAQLSCMINFCTLLVHHDIRLYEKGPFPMTASSYPDYKSIPWKRLGPSLYERNMMITGWPPSIPLPITDKTDSNFLSKSASSLTDSQKAHLAKALEDEEIKLVSSYTVMNVFYEVNLQTKSKQTVYKPGRGEKRVAFEDPETSNGDDDFQPVDSKPKKGHRHGSKRQRNVTSIPSSSENVASASTVQVTATHDTTIQSTVPIQGVTGIQAILVPNSKQERHGNIELRAYRQVPQIADNHAYTLQELQEGWNPASNAAMGYHTNSDTMFDGQWE